MRNDFSSNYLAHHGILGQKWGVRNGPPYPLEEKSSVSKERNNKVSHLTKKQKTYTAIGAGVAATTLIAYGSYKLGGPKVAASKIAKVLSNGKKVSKPYMKMNLQYFAKKRRPTAIANPSKYRSLKPEEFPKGANPGRALQEAINLHREKIKSGEAFYFCHGNYTYVIVGDGEGYDGRIINCIQISGTGTGLYKREPYVK